MGWAANNIGAIITILVVISGVIGTWALYGERIKRNAKDIEKLQVLVKDLSTTVQLHAGDTTLHLDANRDKRIWDDFKSENMRRFDRLEEKIERLMIHTPPS